MSIGNQWEAKILNCIRGGGLGTAIAAPGTLWAQMHTGDPGEMGTLNVAGETTRQIVAFGAESGGVILATTLPAWTNVSTTETWTHASIHDAVTAGTMVMYGQLSAAKNVSAGDSPAFASMQMSVD